MDTQRKRHLYKLRWKRENRRNHGEKVRQQERDQYARIPLTRRKERARIHNLKHRIRKTQWQRKNFRLYAYGLSLEHFRDMIHAQHGRCAICKVKPKEVLFVDHHHATKKVRALLCRKCNYAMAAIDSCPGWLEKAKAYIHS